VKDLATFDRAFDDAVKRIGEFDPDWIAQQVKSAAAPDGTDTFLLRTQSELSEATSRLRAVLHS
jgi:hypothetical protein